jgi:hypothetical protein
MARPAVGPIDARGVLVVLLQRLRNLIRAVEPRVLFSVA